MMLRFAKVRKIFHFMILLPSICDRRVLPTSAGNKCAAGMDEKTRESYVSPFGSKGDVQFPCRECVIVSGGARGAGSVICGACCRCLSCGHAC